MDTSGALRRENADVYLNVIARSARDEAIQLSFVVLQESWTSGQARGFAAEGELPPEIAAAYAAVTPKGELPAKARVNSSAFTQRWKRVGRGLWRRCQGQWR